MRRREFIAVVGSAPASMNDQKKIRRIKAHPAPCGPLTLPRLKVGARWAV